MKPRYDAIGVGYTTTRVADPRIGRAIDAALDDARSVANIGAGTGNYEPLDRDVIAVEPSEVMLAQRTREAAPAINGTAERIPLDDASVDAAMTVFSDHHWDDSACGLAEMKRIARRRVVALTIDHSADDRFWLLRDYLTEYTPLRPKSGPSLYELALASGATVQPLPVPADCTDGFFRAFWRRPEAYLDPQVSTGISVFHRLDPVHAESAIRRLADDLESGRWHEQNAALLDLDELDLGLRLVVWQRRM